MNLKSISLFALAAAAAVSVSALFSACGKSETAPVKKIGISIPAADHGWTGGIVFWAEQAKKKIESENPGVKVLIASAKDASEQIDKIENLMVQKIDALVVLPQEPEPLTAICSRAAGKGIKLIVVDRGLTQSVQTLSVVGDNRGFGKTAAEAMAKELGGKGNIVVMEGIPCVVNSDRVNAFNEVMNQYPGIKILQSQAANWDPEKGMALMETYLQKFPQIDAVWTGDDDVLESALKAYSASGRNDVKFMIGGGGSKAVVKLVMDKNPLVPLTVTYPPKMIFAAAQEALAILNGKAVPSDKTMVLPAEIVRPENAKEYYFPESAY